MKKEPTDNPQDQSEDEYPSAVVREVDGELVLDDPQAVAIIKAISKLKCEATLNLSRERVLHFAKRVQELKKSSSEVVIVIINVDDVHGDPIAEILMPGHNWQEYRDRQEVPFARGLADRQGIQKCLQVFDEEAAKKLEQTKGLAIVVVDHEVAEVFPSVLELTEENVQNIFNECFVNEIDVKMQKVIRVSGISITRFSFNPELINKNKFVIKQMLLQLPTKYFKFFMDKGEEGITGGDAFLGIKTREDGVTWTELQSEIEKLVTLGIAAGYANWSISWVDPDINSYVVVNNKL